jgi:NitT/TauT family transport system substrate-binding protein
MRKGIVFCCLVLWLAGCTPKKPQSITIAQQYGTAYAPIVVMRELDLLQETLPSSVTVEWVQLANTAAIRESMLAGKTQIACMAIPPFLIGRDAGMEWRICSGVSRVPMGLTTREPGVESLADIAPKMRIALPQPGSIQHILLAMAARREFGEAHRFDHQLVTLSHPDGMNALLSGGEVSLHFTTSPYLQQEQQAGMTLILDGEEAMGQPFTGIVAVAGESLYREHPKVYQGFLKALKKAMEWIEEHPQEAAELLAPLYGMEPDALLLEMTAPGAAYTTEVEGVEAFTAFMLEEGYLKKEHSLDSLLFPEAVA